MPNGRLEISIPAESILSIVDLSGKVVRILGEEYVIKKNPYHVLDPTKPRYVLSKPVPWFDHRAPLPRPVFEKARLFSEIMSTMAGKRREEILRTLRERMGPRKPRTPRVKPAGTRFHERFATYESYIGVVKSATVPATAPTTTTATETAPATTTATRSRRIRSE